MHVVCCLVIICWCHCYWRSHPQYLRTKGNGMCCAS